MKPKQNPYPWYAINDVTRRLEPYAAYAASREDFNRLYQPEPDAALIENGHLDAEALEENVLGDEKRYGWLSEEPIMRDVVHQLMYDPERFSVLAEINKKYMDGFTQMRVFDQARIHIMTACRVMGHWDDHIIAKKWLRDKSLGLWARAWIRGFNKESGRQRYFPTEDQINAFYRKLPPIKARNEKDRQWPWERIVRSLGLDGIRGTRESGRNDDSKNCSHSIQLGHARHPDTGTVGSNRAVAEQSNGDGTLHVISDNTSRKTPD